MIRFHPNNRVRSEKREQSGGRMINEKVRLDKSLVYENEVCVKDSSNLYRLSSYSIQKLMQGSKHDDNKQLLHHNQTSTLILPYP